jgi:hypothetical protein
MIIEDPVISEDQKSSDACAPKNYYEKKFFCLTIDNIYQQIF